MTLSSIFFISSFGKNMKKSQITLNNYNITSSSVNSELNKLNPTVSLFSFEQNTAITVQISCGDIFLLLSTLTVG